MKNGLILCVPDVHAPYQNKRAWELMLEIVDFAKPAQTIQLGDFADNKAFSRHGRSFGERFDPERDMHLVKNEAQRLEKAACNKMVMLLGNHDFWFYRHAAENAPAFETFIPKYSQLYGIREEPKNYQEIYKVGKVGYVHDLGFAGKNALHSTLATAGHCIVFGHTHRLGTTYSGTVEGDRWVALNCGWLGDVSKITYMNRAACRDWQLGFGAVRYVDGLAYMSGIPMIEIPRRGRLPGKVHCYFGGKHFKS